MKTQLHTILVLLSVLSVGCSDRPPPDPKAAFQCIIQDAAAGLEQLLRDGLSPDAAPDTDREDMTLLHYASSLGSPSTIEVLVKAGADINAKTEFSVTPLLATMIARSSENALALIALGADVNARNLAGASPLHFAVASKDLEVTRALLAEGADVNAQTTAKGGTALISAVILDSVDIVSLLMASGADKNMEDHSGNTAMDYAKSDEMKRVLNTGPETDKLD